MERPTKIEAITDFSLNNKNMMKRSQLAAVIPTPYWHVACRRLAIVIQA